MSYQHVLDGPAVHAFMERVFPAANSILQIVSWGEGQMRCVSPKGAPNHHIRPGGTISGPTLMGLADSAMYLLVLSLVGEKALAVTSNLEIQFLRKTPSADLHCETRILRLGKRLAVGTVEITSADVSDGPIAFSTVTYAIPR